MNAAIETDIKDALGKITFPLPPYEIGRIIGRPRTEVTKAAIAMYQRGELERISNGLYQLPGRIQGKVDKPAAAKAPGVVPGSARVFQRVADKDKKIAALKRIELLVNDSVREVLKTIRADLNRMDACARGIVK